jgi:hypothetical protein
MTDKEAMKLALFALDIVKIHYTQSRHVNEAITALKERLADPMREVQRLGQEIEQEPICPECKAEVLYECVACSSNNYPPQRTEPVSDDIASIIACRDMLDAQPVPPRSTEQNFCPRCGKRTKDMTHIHTCTPPKD